ncbi:MAG: UDP-N-acetylglucosamine--N-acetylmuramyl-(pentapeptide) pyrophosphoryl-undecaprenol N-acetylglucosamine transferase, partial [Endomicrobia bacterium]|nr:UDP-N-acetylglucosamine--N-acetylmuramyl-(pentapeptide) pyrophosphoryl-undecaprenol N-acetylglucosamine transferase [Endomicrobiia bacterium]
MKLLIVTSPTGGHFYPAIEVCKKMLPYCSQIVFVTQKDNKFLPTIVEYLKFSDKIKIELITAKKFLRKDPIIIFKLLYYMTLSIIKSLLILVKNKPNIIFSTGGYTAVPVVLTGKLFFPFLPIILHEQNCVFSLTTKLLSIFAKKICLGFDIKRNDKFVFTGNPIRTTFTQYVNKDKIYSKLGFSNKKLTLLIFGGSQGARSINIAILNFIKKYTHQLNTIQILHITGFSDFNYINNEYKNVKTLHYRIFPYVDAMEEVYSIADIVISRAGAMTISELIFFKLPSILVPLPTAAELHQHHNANFLKRYGCAKVVFQKKGWEQILYDTILEFI